jgi:hypothetical protein
MRSLLSIASMLFACQAKPVGPTTEASAETASDDENASSGSTAVGDENTEGVGATATSRSSGTEETVGTSTEGLTSGTDGGVFVCQQTLCQGKIHACGDCEDNDGDGLVDAADPSCWGPCDNNESGWNAYLVGNGPTSPCLSADCYFDGDAGSGNDDCRWGPSCDPLEPYFCTYDPEAPIGGTSMTCEEASTMQSPQCETYCGPLVPNGCDCFGCCEITLGDESHTVYLGWSWGRGTCGPETLGDPEACAPCTQVPACLNPCEPESCEICIGQTTLPDGCRESGCPVGVQPCLPEHESGDCPEGMACITGCCIPFPV